MLKRIKIIDSVCCVFLLLFSVYTSKAQVYDKYMPPEPGVASFKKNIENPINLYNGTVSIPISLYTVSDGSISIPISLNYNSSGIKVMEEASWVGLGWNLDVGGMIEKIPIGLDDMNFSNIDKWLPKSPGTYPIGIPTICSDDQANAILDMAELGSYMPDIYVYSFNGNSGKFFIDVRTNEAHQLSFTEKVLFKYNGTKNTWNAITLDGSIYEFNTKSLTRTVNSTSAYISPTTYYLTKHILPNKQEVEYLYKYKGISQGVACAFEQRVFLKNDNPNYGSRATLNSANANLNAMYILEQVNTTNYSVQFNSSDRIDVDKGSKLDSIIIFNKTDNINKKYTFKFAYSYFKSDFDAGYRTTSNYPTLVNPTLESNRLKLDKITDQTIDNFYLFDYYGPILPPKTSFGVDYWGYYNGKENINKTLLPKLSYLNLDDKELNYETLIFGANRTCDIEYIKACMLKSIQYPTKGKTVFNYESNEFIGNIPNSQQVEPFNTIHLISKLGGQSENFTISQPTNLNITIEIGRGKNLWTAFSADCTFYLMRINGGVSTVVSENYNVYSTDNSQNTIIKNFNLPINTPGSYSIGIGLSSNLPQQDYYSGNQAYMRLLVVGSVSSYTSIEKSLGGGLRLKKIDHFDYNSQIPAYSKLS